MAPRIVDREKKSRRIVEQAMFVFARRGYNTTTMEAIAEQAGIGKGTLYEYFQSKQDLFLACFETYIDQYFETIEAQTGAAGNGSASEQLRRATHAAFAFADHVEELFPLTFEFWAASASSRMRGRIMDLFRGMYAQARRLLGAIIQRGIEEGEFDANIHVASVTAVLVGSFDGLFLQAWFDPNMNPLRAGTAFIDVVIRGLETCNRQTEKKILAGGNHA